MASDSIGQLRRIDEQFERDRTGIVDLRTLEQVRAHYLSRKSGLLTVQLQALRDLPRDQKAEFGRLGNELRRKIETALSEREAELAEAERRAGRAAETLDVTLPGARRRAGHRHPLSLVREEMERIFVSMGYTVEDGPEVETAYYNFEALNIPAGHPSRADSDTFYLSDEVLLRTQTSPVQVRTMERRQPPIRIVCPGRVFRRDALDATHSPMFHQIEGLVVDADITFADLKGTLDLFHKQFFGEDTKVRLRPSYFPFTEPSAEVDISCLFCEQKGCRVCKHTGWIELMGAGLVNPVLYGFVGYDAERLSGFAFGGGIDRYAMLKYGISDLPLLFQNDVRFLEQF